MDFSSFLVAWSTLLVSSLVSSVGSEGATRIAPGDIPAIYNFGDSNSDTGGIAAAFFPMAAPCGETFFHRPVGRASDGRLIIDFIAERLKLPYLSAYLDSIGTDFRHGANFATGGATIRRQNESWFENGISPFPLDIQVEHFVQFKARSTYLQDQAINETFRRSNLPIPEEFSKALYTFDIGQNDLAVGFRKMTDEQLRAAIPDIVNQLAAAVQTFLLHRDPSSSGEILHQPSMATYRLPSKPLDLDVTIVFAKHLKNVNRRHGNLKPYAIF
ncbi:hypothetical protein U1Q18_041819 [Sarracenia purpurea var. burkii]